MLTVRFVIIIAVVPVIAGILWWVARRGRRVMEVTFLGLWMVAALSHRAAMACLSRAGRRHAGEENYRIVARVIVGVWVLAVAIRLIEHLRYRRAGQA